MEYIKYLRKMIGHKPVNVPGAVIIIHDANKILLQKRRQNGKWGLIGGLMELGESFEETAQREAREEAGIEVFSLKLVTTHSGEYSYIKVDSGDEFYASTVCFSSDDYKGQVRINDRESLALKFFDFDELPENIVGSHHKMIKIFMEKR